MRLIYYAVKVSVVQTIYSAYHVKNDFIEQKRLSLSNNNKNYFNNIYLVTFTLRHFFALHF